MIEIAVASGIVITALVAIYALYKIDAKIWLIMLLAPWMLFSVGFGFLLYDKIKGYATKESFTDSKLLYSKIVKPDIFVLVIGDNGPRLHVIPYNEQLEEQLKGAYKAMEQGRDMRIREKDGESVFGIEIYEFDHKRAFPKDKIQ